MNDFYGAMEAYNDGDRVQCLSCNKPVSVKFFEKGAVVVVSSQEQQELALRCQNCGYVMCDTCAHPADSMYPICPSCNQEWGPYYFTHEAFTPTIPSAAVGGDIQLPPPQTWAPEVPLPIEPNALNIEVPDWSKKSRRRLMMILRILGVLFLLALLAGGIYYISGPGAPLMKEAFSALGARPTRTNTATPTAKLTLTRIVATPIKQNSRTPEPTWTASLTPAAFTPVTFTPVTFTPVTFTPMGVTPQISNTPQPSPTPTSTPTLTPTSGNCKPALLVTMEDVGQTLCVTGKVMETELRNDVFYIFFGSEKSTFYIVVYDQVPENVKKGVCVQVEGEIQKLGSYPVVILRYTDIIQICP